LQYSLHLRHSSIFLYQSYMHIFYKQLLTI